MNKNIVLPLIPFAPIVYFSLINSNIVTFEIFENYPKQTYRNRYSILAANGVISLTIPVVGQEGIKTIVSDVLIDNRVNWQELHFRSIESAYRSSAFYDHYMDIFYQLFQKKYEKLMDFNIDSLELIFKILKLKTEILKTTEFIVKPENTVDFRNKFKPSKQNWEQNYFNNYFQVFLYKFGFQKNLSIIDLIFNEGSAAVIYI
jgi:WbqC-like protein family